MNEIRAFLSGVLFDEDCDVKVRMKAAELLSKPSGEKESSAEPLKVRVIYPKKDEEISLER